MVRYIDEEVKIKKISYRDGIATIIVGTVCSASNEFLCASESLKIESGRVSPRVSKGHLGLTPDQTETTKLNMRTAHRMRNAHSAAKKTIERTRYMSQRGPSYVTGA